MLGYESGFIRIIDNTGEDYLYEPDDFEIVENDENKAKRFANKDLGD